MELTEQPDVRLIEATLAGNPQAYARLVKRYQATVCSVAYSTVGDVSLSEDVAQETFLRAWRALSSLREREKLGPWLCGIARNVARETLRSRRREVSAAASEDTPTLQPNPSESVMAAEREAIVWGALGDLPEPYREALILYYREGQSTRAVADALDTTEEAIRQRLSRGRHMLRDRVAALVEETLGATRPTHAFTAAVAALLVPAMAAGGTASASVAKGAGATGAAAVAGKGLSALGVGALGGLAGAAAGIAGGFIGTRAGLHHARTLALRRYMLKVSGLTYAFIWGFLAVQGILGMLLWRDPRIMYSACGAAWIAYAVLLFLLIARTNLRYARIRREGADAPLPPDLSLARVRWNLAWTLTTAAFGSAALVLWAWSFPAIHALWLHFAVLGLVSHLAIGTLLLRAYRTVRSDEAFRASCPTGPEPIAEAPSVDPVTRWRRVSRHAFGGLVGGTVGPMCWLYVAALIAEAWLDAAFLVAVTAGVVLAAGLAVRRRPTRVYLVNAVGMAFMGIFSSAVIALLWPRWLEAAGERMPEGFPVGGAAIYLLLYGCFAAVMLFLHRHRHDLHR